MQNNPLVSIIIPTYNRAHLIGETLDSIVSQTYKNWECIIVDDGSTDNTEEIVNKYIKKDNRFQYHLRPEYHKSGGNGARNYGFKLSKGEYVNFFDSDDLMIDCKIEKQLQIILKNDIQFSVAKFLNFKRKEETFIKVNKSNEQFPVKREDYLTQIIFWGTIDVVAKKNFFLNSIFNENLKSGQEYNFFVNALSKAINYKGIFLDEILSFRRIHSTSIQETQFKNPKELNVNKFNVYYQTLIDVDKIINLNEKKYLIKKVVLRYIFLIRDKSFNEYYYTILKYCKENYKLFHYIQIKFLLVYLKYIQYGNSKIKLYLDKIL